MDLDQLEKGLSAHVVEALRAHVGIGDVGIAPDEKEQASQKEPATHPHVLGPATPFVRDALGCRIRFGGDGAAPEYFGASL